MKVVKAALLVGMILCSVSVVRAQVSIGIQIGAPPPPPAVVYVQPPQPEPDFVWVEGYWYPVGHHYKWHEGYWTRPPYAGAVWVPPHHDGKKYFAGYWQRGRAKHDHEEHEHDRDHGHGHGHGDDH